jgi:ribosomal-protein-alanine N-acetyltransferase
MSRTPSTVIALPHTIDSERLRLRLPTLADAPALVERWASDPRCTRYLLFATYAPGDVAAGEAFIRMCLANWEAGSAHLAWIMSERESGEVVGMIGVTPTTGPHAWEVGYVLRHASWGRGYATEAVRAVVGVLFGDARVRRVVAPTHIDNLASQHVLAKAGFSLEAKPRRYYVFPAFGSEPQDCTLWSLTR